MSSTLAGDRSPRKCFYDFKSNRAYYRPESVQSVAAINLPRESRNSVGLDGLLSRTTAMNEHDLATNRYYTLSKDSYPTFHIARDVNGTKILSGGIEGVLCVICEVVLLADQSPHTPIFRLMALLLCTHTTMTGLTYLRISFCKLPSRIQGVNRGKPS